ncbi:ATP-dependent DNA helicase [Dothidotthia symphoricarpi CBS 119687]|uniref:ATP-dependent DNA helicase n=1 Tax=Dothidotthia symphoricarpi CBS 119687 TaxID=1392245 RepID=A0A6A5ZZP6_9PLEO|nr:ATP-dependent DNA helicase [Dothidotthia symphoricarpi CBS 119687]KAF2125222.1 ATP-dependent DNA helicase [Dothidotthia symphoricarpi CBS 119687]
MSNDEFDMSSEDEAALVAASARVTNAKRDRSHEVALRPGKRSKITNKTNTAPSHNTVLANKILKEHFNLDGFRLEQEAAISRLLDGNSAVIVFPTGGGKSLCYQVPAVAFKYQDQEDGSRASGYHGITLVISPLIALMKDQVDALLRNNIKAAVLNSSVSRDQYLAVHDDLRNGRLDLLYCAPERLNNEGFIATLKAIPGGIRLLAVDEAHCISEWGHSFRPDYLKIARFAEEAEVERVVCLTATATPKVSEDILTAFSIPKEGLLRTTMYRPNLRLLAEANPKGTDYEAKLVVHLKANPGPTIVYITQQKAAMELAATLKSKGFPAKPYHAGMTPELRTQTQDEFLGSENMIVVATIAFGMGIDKPDIRNIVHFDIPDSIESYCQQIGRAGRDGKPSTCMFYLSTKDFHIRNIFTYGDRPSLHSLRLLFKDLCSPHRKELNVGDTFTVELYTQSRDVDITPTILGILYAQLELHFKLFRAAGTQYNRYKYTVKDRRILDNDISPAAHAIKGASKQLQKWTHIALDELTASTGIPRADLVRTLETWNEYDAIDLRKESVSHVFRLLRPLPSSATEINDIITHLDSSMGATEQQNLARTKSLIDLITSKQCFSRSLAAYFGETKNLPKACMHCTWCETHTQVVLPNEPPLPPDEAKVRNVLDAVGVRDDPRFLAKIAFGINSPRITALKIKQTGVFESMNVCDFEALVSVFRKACGEE